MKKLKKQEIRQIKDSLISKFDEPTLKAVWDNFNTMHLVLESKIHLDTWTEQDKQDVLSSFKQGCYNSTNLFCHVVMKEFLSFIDKYEGYEKYEYCRCCSVEYLCAGNIRNRKGNEWHYNICLIWNNLSKGPFDLDYIKGIWNKIKNSKDLKELRILFEVW